MLERAVQVGVVASVVALMVGGMSLAQQGGAGGGQGGGGQRGGGFRGGRGMFDPSQIRQMMMARMQEQLGVQNDAEWKVIEPRLGKLMELNQQVLMSRVQGMFGGFGGPGMFGGRGGPGGGNEGGQNPMTRGSGPNGEMTALDKAMAQLRTTLENTSATPEEIKRGLTAVREAGAKLQQDRTAAQADLKKILTPRQEALLVTMGQLD